MMYYTLLGPTIIAHPDVPPDKTWADGMKDWAMNATVRFMKFTQPLPGLVGARVEIIELSPECRVQPVRCPKRLEVPYSWLAPLPNYHVFLDSPGHVYAGFDKNTKIEVI